MLLAIPFPDIDPVALSIGPLAIKWYGLAYLAGLVLG
jgi:phosphatidylglycerol:prolipoprotein diacylglycerol transferase